VKWEVRGASSTTPVTLKRVESLFMAMDFPMGSPSGKYRSLLDSEIRIVKGSSRHELGSPCSRFMVNTSKKVESAYIMQFSKNLFSGDAHMSLFRAKSIRQLFSISGISSLRTGPMIGAFQAPFISDPAIFASMYSL